MQPNYCYRKGLLFGLFTALCLAVKAQSPAALSDSIDQLLSAWKSKVGPGISVAVVQEGQVLYSKSFGMANIPAGRANEPSTTFWIASVTKQFTAAAVYQLAAQKKIEPNRSVRFYLPELPALYQRVTIDQLIHHTSGIRDGFVLTALSKKPSSEYTNANVLHYLKASRSFSYEPGTQYEYNNSGYVLLAAVIEKVSGKPYAAYMKEHIFQPLGMEQTYVSGTFPKSEAQAEGYQETAPGTYQAYHFEGNTYGSTGIITTLPDLTRWAQFLQDPGTAPLLANSVQHLLQPGKLKNGSPIAYAGGLEKLSYRGKTMYEHFGADEGFKADILYFPASKLSIIGLTNHQNYYGLLNLLCTISDLAHEGRTFPPAGVDESKAQQSEQYYYNPELPQLARVQHFPGYVRLSHSTSGYAAPYHVIGDTLQSLDPLPERFLLKGKSLRALDPSYHKNTVLTLLQPSSRTNDFTTFEGEFFSDELQTAYRILSTDKGVQFEFLPGMAFNLFRLTGSDFVFDFQGPNFLQFTEEGFFLSREGCRKLFFKKR